MRARVRFIVVFICLAATPLAVHEATWYVDGAVKRSGNGQSWAGAFRTIQEGIDAAGDGDAVSVKAGRYSENIKFRGRGIVLESSEWASRGTVGDAIIDGGGIGSVVTFDSGEGRETVLRGFTITNGLGYGGLGGGVLCINGSSPVTLSSRMWLSAAERLTSERGPAGV